MAPPAIDPSLTTAGGEWAVGLGDAAGAATPAAPGSATSFGAMLADQIGALERVQEQAAQGSRALASGTATDPTQVVLAVERARLSMQLASQLRNKAVEAVQEIFHTQV